LFSYMGRRKHCRVSRDSCAVCRSVDVSAAVVVRADTAEQCSLLCGPKEDTGARDVKSLACGTRRVGAREPDDFQLLKDGVSRPRTGGIRPDRCTHDSLCLFDSAQLFCVAAVMVVKGEERVVTR
jgi:hypothetical protein